jgi:DNA-binding transcriptional MerR regulator
LSEDRHRIRPDDIALIDSHGEHRVTSDAHDELDDLEQAHPSGLSVHQIVEACAANGDRLTEATFRKYVQLGLLPRSVRVGRKGKHRGSQGLYPASIVRQVQRLRKLMAQGFTIDEIQTRFLAVGSEVGALAKELERVISQLERTPQTSDSLVKREIEEARKLSVALIDKLRDVERRLTVQARLSRAAV